MDQKWAQLIIKISNRIKILKFLSIFTLIILPYFDTPNWCQTKFKGKPEITWCGYNKSFNLDPKYTPS
jgi:hypothetical protein